MSELLTTTGKTILIASSALDETAWKPVADNLSSSGYDVIVYEADKVADGRASLEVAINGRHGMSVHYNGQILDLASVSAAWYRRPNIFGTEQDNKTAQMCLDVERRALQYTLWDTIHENAWLNAPRRVTHAEHKLTQLVLAQEVGFDIPDTAVTNRWESVTGQLPDRVIFKPSYALFYSQDDMRLLYTTPFDNPAELPTEGLPYPGLWQSYLYKAREWRITVVGDETFDAAIYTDETAKDDWRRHQLASKVSFVREAFPDSQKDKCHAYLGELGLRFGCFDFTEDDEGNVTFLECNANGQFGWLEDELEFPISDAIASELRAVARQQ